MMAKLSAHDISKDRIVNFLTFKKAYGTDGIILIDRGDGWKKYGKVKEGFTPDQALARAKEKQAEKERNQPFYAKFKKALHAETTMKNRAEVMALIQIMYDDPDGIWATLDDYGMRIEITDLCELCQLYKLAKDEIKD